MATPKFTPKVTFYDYLIRFERGEFDAEELRSKTRTFIKAEPHLSPVLEGSLLSRQSVPDLHDTLLACSSAYEFRQKLGDVLGYNRGEANVIFPGLFKESGPRAEPTKHIETFELGLRLAAFLETSHSLIHKERMFESRTENPWYYHLQHEYNPGELVELFELPHDAESRSFECARYSISENESASTVGVSRTYLPGMIEVTIWIDQYINAYWSDWENILFSIGAGCGTDAIYYAIYVQSSPILTGSRERLHRMIWVKDSNIENMIKLYRRLFSSRTEEITIFHHNWSYEQLITIRHPDQQRERIVQLLDDLGMKPTERIRYPFKRKRTVR